MDSGKVGRRVPAGWWASGLSREMLDDGKRPPGPLLALAQTILLAALTAMAVSVVLVAATVFFASRAFAGEALPGRALEAGQGSLLVAMDGALVPAPLVRTDVTMRVTGPVARVQVRQRFLNPADRWLEGVYVFPLPESAAVDGYRMRVGERVVVGELRERDAARRTYLAAREAGQRTALLDQERPNVFTASVANLAPRESLVVEIEYQQLARWDAGAFTLRFPMVVGPRYVGCNQDGDSCPAEGAVVADAARITPPVLRPEDVPAGRVHNPVSMQIALVPGAPLAGLESRTHEIAVSEGGDGAYRVSFTADEVPADRDFELRWSPRAGSAPQAALFAERDGETAYALLMLLPPAAATGETRLPREAIFVIDTSGSMHGASIAQAREALQFALARLQPGDRFNVIEFNARMRALFDTPRPASRQNVATASDWVARLRAEGGTEMAPALTAALDARAHPGVVRQVVFLTDGAVGNEEELLRLVTARLGDSRLFTVGIGSAPNGHFMVRAARLGRGTFTYIGDAGEVREKMGALFAKLDAPVLKDVAVEWPDFEAEAWPARVPDLYAGEPLVVVARLRGTDGTVRVRGEQNGIAWTSEVVLAAANEHAGIGKHWAREKIDALADAGREAHDPDAKRGEIVAVALAHGLVTRYTSLVAVDRTPARPADAALASTAVPTLLPAGWVADRVLGPHGPALPQTATAAALRLRIGGVALALGVVLLALPRLRRGV